MARCPHNRVQQFTECCLDCGRNIYESDAEYLKYLRERARAGKYDSEIEKLEAQLGIRHAGNRNQPECDSDGWYPNKYPDM